MFACSWDVAAVFRVKIDGGIRVYFSCICLVGKVYAMLFSFVAMHHLFGCFSIKLSFLDSSVWLLCVYSPVMSSYSSNDCGITSIRCVHLSI